MNRSSLNTVLLGGLVLALVSGCATPAPKTVKHDYGEKEARVAEAALDDAEQQLDAMEIEPAIKDLAAARDALKSAEIEYYPERHVLRSRLAKLESRLGAVQQTRARMERDARIARQQAKVTDAVERLDLTLMPLRTRDVTAADVERAKEAFKQTREAIASGRRMEYQFPIYSKFISETEVAMGAKRSEITLAEGVLAFVNGPAAQREKAKTLLKEASKATTMARPALYKQALTSLVACKMSGKEMLTTVDKLEKAPVLVGGEPTTPKAVTHFCEARADAVEKQIAAATRDATRAQARRVPAALPRPKAK